MSETHTVEVSFQGELFATHLQGETTYRLYRYDGGDEVGFFIHWTGEQGAWLETGRLGGGLSAAQVARSWPDLALRAFVASEQA
jgi:hypothetical protein